MHPSVKRARATLETVEVKMTEHHEVWRADHASELEDLAADALIADFEQQKQEREDWQRSVERWDQRQAKRARQGADLVTRRREYAARRNTNAVEPAVRWKSSRHPDAPKSVEMSAIETVAEEAGAACGKLDARIARLERALKLRAD